MRPKQAAACWLVELGNGDKFIGDIGSQTMSRISGYKIHYDFLRKVLSATCIRTTTPILQRSGSEGSRQIEPIPCGSSVRTHLF